MQKFWFFDYLKGLIFKTSNNNPEETNPVEIYLKTITAKDIMQSRGHMIAINVNDSIGQVCHIFSHSDSSIIPVYEHEIDRIIGAISYKQFLRLLFNSEHKTNNTSLQDLLKNTSKHVSLQRVLFVTQYIDCFLLIKKMKSQKVDMCVVIDEFGGTDGSVTLNDITNFIFSEISEEIISPVSDQHGFFYINGSSTLMSLESIVRQISIVNNNAKELLLRIEEMAEIHDTVNGFICGVVGRVPETGEKVYVANSVFVITESTPRKIKKLKFCFDPFKIGNNINNNNDKNIPTKYIK